MAFHIFWLSIFENGFAFGNGNEDAIEVGQYGCANGAAKTMAKCVGWEGDKRAGVEGHGRVDGGHEKRSSVVWKTNMLLEISCHWNCALA